MFTKKVIEYLENNGIIADEDRLPRIIYMLVIYGKDKAIQALSELFEKGKTDIKIDLLDSIKKDMMERVMESMDATDSISDANFHIKYLSARANCQFLLDWLYGYAAKLGSGEAYYQLSKRDQSHKMDHLLKAAARNHSQAMVELSKIYEERKEFDLQKLMLKRAMNLKNYNGIREWAIYCLNHPEDKESVDRKSCIHVLMELAEQPYQDEKSALYAGDIYADPSNECFEISKAMMLWVKCPFDVTAKARVMNTIVLDVESDYDDNLAESKLELVIDMYRECLEPSPDMEYAYARALVNLGEYSESYKLLMRLGREHKISKAYQLAAFMNQKGLGRPINHELAYKYYSYAIKYASGPSSANYERYLSCVESKDAKKIYLDKEDPYSLTQYEKAKLVRESIGKNEWKIPKTRQAEAIEQQAKENERKEANNPLWNGGKDYWLCWNIKPLMK